MTYKQKVVYEYVEHIIEQRKAKGKFPACALLSEIRSELDDYLTTHCTTAAECVGAVTDISRTWYKDELDALVADGHLRERPAQNEPSYYLL